MNDDLHLRDVEAFTVLMAERNFTRAAERLHTSQQQLSAQIKRFEARLGVDLFRRTTRSVEPTDEAFALLDGAHEVVGGAKRWLDHARRLGGGDTGIVTIGYTQTCGFEVLPALVAAVRREAPGIDLVTRELYATEIEDDVARRSIDIGLVRCPTGRPGTVHEQISHEPLALAVSTRSPFARKRRVALAEATGHLLAMWPRELIPGFFDACISAWTEAGGSRDHIDTSSSGAALWSDIASDRTVGLVVSSFERNRPRDIRLVQLRENTDVGVSVVWPAVGRSPATDRVVELARRRPAPAPR